LEKIKAAPEKLVNQDSGKRLDTSIASFEVVLARRVRLQEPTLLKVRAGRELLLSVSGFIALSSSAGEPRGSEAA
jgi:hypothetical protein